MLRGRDIALLAALSVHPGEGPITIRALSSNLGIAHAGIQRSLDRLAESGLYLPHRGVVIGNLAVELFASAARFLVPPNYLGPGSGTPTAWYGGPLAERLRTSGEDLPVVWPGPSELPARGVVLEPLDPAVPTIAAHDARARDLLRAIDAARIGGAREREVAFEFISDEIESAQWRVD